MGAIAAVVFDIGGVVLESPLHAIARFEGDHGLPAGAINRVVVAAGEGGAWARLERGELTVEAFCAPGGRAPEARPEDLRAGLPGARGVPPAGRVPRALGITTIKVDDPDAALGELGALVGLDLIAPAGR